MPKTPKNIIDPIKAGFDEVTNAMLTRTHKPNEINELHNKSSNSPAPYQSELFKVDTQVEYENIEMGVLD